MRIRDWYNKHREALMGPLMLVAFALLSANFILIGVRAENVYDRGLSLFVGAVFTVPLVMFIASIVKTKRGLGGKG